MAVSLVGLWIRVGGSLVSVWFIQGVHGYACIPFLPPGLRHVHPGIQVLHDAPSHVHPDIHSKFRTMHPAEDCLVSTWVGRGRWVLIDLTAGSFDWGPALGGDGVVHRGSLPRLDDYFGIVQRMAKGVCVWGGGGAKSRVQRTANQMTAPHTPSPHDPITPAPLPPTFPLPPMLLPPCLLQPLCPPHSSHPPALCSAFCSAPCWLISPLPPHTHCVPTLSCAAPASGRVG